MFLLLSLVAGLAAGSAQCTIGVLGLPAYWSTGGDYRPELLDAVNGQVFVAASYVKFLEQFGCRVALISYKLGRDEIRSIVSQVNAVYLTGGAIHYRLASDNSISNVGIAIRHIWEAVLEANDSGIYTPLFGTC